ncbi:hypothetical protein B484DRAFT_390752 [Ochromonadaceae sp. CCMP2298]|nr:hypothetical protein B484DRAFT_390752 [Ochromonadaceae sp. CCMP2298]
MKLFLGALLLLLAAPVNGCFGCLLAVVTDTEDQRPTPRVCNSTELSEIFVKVQGVKDEMIILRQILREQFSHFVFRNGLYEECGRLAALEGKVFKRSLKSLIELYSVRTIDDEDVSRLAQALSYSILPEDIQARITADVIPPPVLGLASYLQRYMGYPNSRQLIISSLLETSSISRIWQLGSYNILTGALHRQMLALDQDVRPFCTSVATLGEALSDNYDNMFGVVGDRGEAWKRW